MWHFLDSNPRSRDPGDKFPPESSAAHAQEGQPVEGVGYLKCKMKRTRQIELKSALLACPYCTAPGVKADTTTQLPWQRDPLLCGEKPTENSSKISARAQHWHWGEERTSAEKHYENYVPYCSTVLLLGGWFVFINFCSRYLMDRWIFNLPYNTYLSHCGYNPHSC